MEAWPTWNSDKINRPLAAFDRVDSGARGVGRAVKRLCHAQPRGNDPGVEGRYISRNRIMLTPFGDIHRTPVARQPCSWMRRVLWAAAIYNVAWGAFAILSPLTLFRWCGFDPLPIYPELWQCIGMIVGVYGVGYGIAARDPFRHWPVVFVGLLGKIFGPIGFVGAVTSGRFPIAMGWTIVTNDLIWWLPFGIILWRAFQSNQATSELKSEQDQ